MKKIISLVLALALVLASCAVALAAVPTGSITVTNAEIGKQYNIYKLFDATVGSEKDANGNNITAYTTTKDVSTDTFFNTYFSITSDGYITQKDTLTETVLKSAEFKAWAKRFAGSKAAEPIVATTGTVTFVDLPYGYYFIESFEPDGNGGWKEATTAYITVDTINPSADVIDKNQTISFDKNIVENGNLVKDNQAGLDINVPFDITVKSKNYEGDEKVFKYIIYDTLDDGFTLQGAPVVKVGNTILAADKYTVKYYTAETNGSEVDVSASTGFSPVQYFEIEIPWTSDGTKDGAFLYQPNDKINVTYSAKLDPKKAADVHVGDTPNLNKAHVKYYKGKDEPNKPSGDLPDSYTRTWETKLTIYKVDGKKEELTGAQFTLTTENGTKVSYVYETKYVPDDSAEAIYYKLKDGTYTKTAPNNNGDLYDSTTQKYKLVSEFGVLGAGQTQTSISSYVDKNGQLTFSGLGTGKYKIEETVVPAGFNKAADIEFTISFKVDTTEPGKPKGDFYCADNDPINEVLGQNGKGINVFETTVINNQGTELPHTGGIGTTIFYILGGLLVVGAAVILVARRKAQD